FAWGYGVGERAASSEASPGRGGAGAGLRVLRRIADWVALRPVRDQLGLTRIKRCYTGGAPLGPDVFGFFHALGVNLKQIYGQTEICGIAVAHRDDDVRFETVGVPIPGTELRIAEDGEILLRSSAVFQGYYRNDRATAEAVDDDGWLHTGDAGYLDEDHLVVIDRAKDVLVASDGTRFSPAFIESKLKFSPFIEEAVVFHSDRPHITALLTIDLQTTGNWAEQRHIGYTTYTDLAQKPAVYELLAEEVARANADLPEAVRVRRFVVLHKQLDADDDEVTRTRKVRRSVIAERYAGIIDALYGEGEEVKVDTTVSYQDGSTATRAISLRLASMDDFTPPTKSRRLSWSGR
ncbi:MAG TPA: AMP-binding protein, partial [Euzebya sp.]|nr:AMP-binding protein [Euzebya sp.]